MSFSFFFYCYGDHRDLHSFPTRRSSDLFLPGSRENDWLWDVEQAAANAHARSSSAELERIRAHGGMRSEEHTSELQSRVDLVCRLLLEKKNVVDEIDHAAKQCQGLA